MDRRGLTLLEVLIAVTLLVALLAIVFPATRAALADRGFETASELVVSHLLLARAHAQATGEPTEVVYVRRPRLLGARRFAPDADPDRGPRGERDRRDDEGVDRFDERSGPPLIGEGWARRILPAGVTITPSPPEDEEGESPPAAVRTDGVGDEPAWFRLAVYLPDGSAIVGEPFWIRDDRDQRGRITINAWTGSPRLEPVEREPGTGGTDVPEPRPDEAEAADFVDDASRAPDREETSRDDPGAEETATGGADRSSPGDPGGDEEEEP